MTSLRLPSVRFLFPLALGAAVLVAAGGCTQVQVGPNIRGEYKFGELQVFAKHDFKRVHEAAKQALKDVGLFQTRDDVKVIEAELNGRDATDTLVIVKLKGVGQDWTSVKIRYGLKGDLASAQKLYQAIGKRL